MNAMPERERSSLRVCLHPKTIQNRETSEHVALVEGAVGFHCRYQTCIGPQGGSTCSLLVTSQFEKAEISKQRDT